MPVVNLTVELAPNRRRMAKSCRRLLQIIAASDSKLYGRGKAFLPIFPTDNLPLQTALTTVSDQLTAVLGLNP